MVGYRQDPSGTRRDRLLGRLRHGAGATAAHLGQAYGRSATIGKMKLADELTLAWARLEHDLIRVKNQLRARRRQCEKPRQNEGKTPG